MWSVHTWLGIRYVNVLVSWNRHQERLKKDTKYIETNHMIIFDQSDSLVINTALYFQRYLPVAVVLTVYLAEIMGKSASGFKMTVLRCFLYCIEGLTFWYLVLKSCKIDEKGRLSQWKLPKHVPCDPIWPIGKAEFCIKKLMKLLVRHCWCTEARWCGLTIQATEWTPRAIRCCKAISSQHRTPCKGILSKNCVFDVDKCVF